LVLKNYKDHVSESVQRVRGSNPQRAFIGLRLKSLDEIAEAERQKMENAGTQAAPVQAALAYKPEPIDDENPFD
jgi:hypothetical protein